MSQLQNDQQPVLEEDRESLVREYLKRLDRCKRTGQINLDETMELVAAAKGLTTKKKFAETIGVNASTATRILNGETKAMQNLQIARIAAFADPDSGVTLEKLMRAQGLVDMSERRTMSFKFVDDCKNIIVEEFRIRNYTIGALRSSEREFWYDFKIETDALWSENRTWAFECKTLISPSGIYNVMSWIHKAMVACYCGEKYGRISVVINNEQIFSRLRNLISKHRIPDEISVILFSELENKFVDEYIIPLTDDRETISLFAKSLHDK